MNVLQKIRENTRGMTRRERAEYVLTYYWYHMLGIAAAAGILIFSIVHFAFPEPSPVFSCAMVNLKIDYERDKELAEAFAAAAGLKPESVVIDSNYHISFTEERSAQNESAFDKFFFKWAGRELDAVVMSEDFLRYCISVGGEFYSEQELTQGEENVKITWREVEGMSAVPVSETVLWDYLEKSEKETEENLLLAFPGEGENKETCREFLEFIAGERQNEGTEYEKTEY